MNRISASESSTAGDADSALRAALEHVFARHRQQPGALLPILHDIQRTLGHVPPQAVPAIAMELNLSRAEVHGVLTYYHHFRQTPTGQHRVRVCCAESCQANGGEALASHALARLQNANIALEPVYCLGLCAIGPAVQINDTSLHARMTPERLDALIDDLEQRS